MRFAALLGLLLFAGCGGDGGGFSGPPDPPPGAIECTALVDWDPPTTYTGGKPLDAAELDKYTLYVGSTPGVDRATIEMVIDIFDGYLIQWQTTGLVPGEHFFYMTVTVDGETSIYSNEKSKVCAS